MADEIVDVKTFGQGIIKAEKLKLDTKKKPDPKKATKKIVLKPGQQEVAKFYDLLKYRDEYFEKDISGGNTWLQQILYEIIDLKCQSDPSVKLTSTCPTFRAYLLHLSLMSMRYPQSSKKPFLKPDPAISAKGTSSEKEDGDTDTDSDHTRVKITIQIPLSKFTDSSSLLAIYAELHTKMLGWMKDLYGDFSDKDILELIKLQLNTHYDLDIMMAQLTAT